MQQEGSKHTASTQQAGSKHPVRTQEAMELPSYELDNKQVLMAPWVFLQRRNLTFINTNHLHKYFSKRLGPKYSLKPGSDRL